MRAPEIGNDRWPGKNSPTKNDARNFQTPKIFQGRIAEFPGVEIFWGEVAEGATDSIDHDPSTRARSSQPADGEGGEGARAGQGGPPAGRNRQKSAINRDNAP